jgi:uncharacterized protein (TIGR02001 family)
LAHILLLVACGFIHPAFNLTIKECIMMKSKLLNSLILAALAVPGVAMAADAAPAPAVVANVGWVSNYVFRGITQTVGKPAVQGGYDYSHSSGFYAGVWGSNVSWITGSGSAGDVSLETDTYLGIRNSFATDYSYDVGFIRYNYFGTYLPPAGYAKADTNEGYGSIGWKWLSAKLSYAMGGAFLTVPGAAGTTYLEANINYPVGDTGYTLGAHIGKQKYKGTFADGLVAAGTDPSYQDYKVNVTKDFSGYVVGLAFTNTNAKSGGYYTYSSLGVPRDWGKSAVAVSVNHSF